jgi:hypothetical protein
MLEVRLAANDGVAELCCVVDTSSAIVAKVKLAS